MYFYDDPKILKNSASNKLTENSLLTWEQVKNEDPIIKNPNREMKNNSVFLPVLRSVPQSLLYTVEPDNRIDYANDKIRDQIRFVKLDRDKNASDNILEQGLSNFNSGCGTYSESKQKRGEALPIEASLRATKPKHL